METTLAMPTFRTQLFNAEDIENVKKVQAGYKVATLSAFLGQPAPKASPADFPKALTVQQQKRRWSSSGCGEQSPCSSRRPTPPRSN